MAYSETVLPSLRHPHLYEQLPLHDADDAVPRAHHLWANPLPYPLLAQDPSSHMMYPAPDSLVHQHKPFDPLGLPPLAMSSSSTRHPAPLDPALAQGGISPYPDSAATSSTGPFSSSSPPQLDNTPPPPPQPPIVAHSSASTPKANNALGRARRARKEKPYIALAPDQPPTTQGKPRTRVFVACLQW